MYTRPFLIVFVLVVDCVVPIIYSGTYKQSVDDNCFSHIALPETDKLVR